MARLTTKQKATAAVKVKGKILRAQHAAATRMKNQNSGQTVKIKLSQALFNELESFAKARGATMETLIRVATSTLIRAQRYYELNTKLTFGKYSGETLETVIRLHPEYINWALQNIENFSISDDAAKLLASIQES